MRTMGARPTLGRHSRIASALLTHCPAPVLWSDDDTDNEKDDDDDDETLSMAASNSIALEEDDDEDTLSMAESSMLEEEEDDDDCRRHEFDMTEIQYTQESRSEGTSFGNYNNHASQPSKQMNEIPCVSVERMEEQTSPVFPSSASIVSLKPEEEDDESDNLSISSFGGGVATLKGPRAVGCRRCHSTDDMKMVFATTNTNFHGPIRKRRRRSSFHAIC